METFKEFLEKDFVEFVLNEFDHQAPQMQRKVWSAKKEEILRMWKTLRGDIPIMITPVSKMGDGQTYGEDGIRITGSWNFISSVLGRLKEILAYENPQTKLRLVFRGVDSARNARPDRQSYVFYINLDNRGKGKAGRPKTAQIGL